MTTTNIGICPNVHLFILDNEGVIFSEDQQSIYKLNTSVTYIWCLLEEGRTVESIISNYSDTFSYSRTESGELVLKILNTLRSMGLIESTDGDCISSSSEEQVQTTREPETESNLPSYKEQEVIHSRKYLLLNSCIRISYTADEQFSWIHPVLAHLEAGAETHEDGIIDIVSSAVGFLIYLDKKPCACVGDIRSLAPRIKGLVIQAAINRHAYFIYSHAGVVAKDGYCLLLPGKAGSGKSTLTAALIQSGYQYLSDEIALLEDSTFFVRPTPIALGCKSTGWEPLKAYYPEIDELPVHHREDGKLVRYLVPPQALSRINLRQSLPVRAIIFPHYVQGCATSIQPRQKISALHAILDDCLALPTRLTRNNVEEMITWIKGLHCYNLTLSSLSDAIEAINSIYPETGDG